LNLDNEGIVDLIDQMDKEARAIRDESLRIVWFMRGGISYDEASYLSAQERELISKIVKDNMETTEKSGLPFF
jgi:hypothetical protein